MNTPESASAGEQGIQSDAKALNYARDRVFEPSETPFEVKYYHNRTGELTRVEPDGGCTEIQLYELTINMQDGAERAEKLREFMLSAAAAGYESAIGPVTLPPGEKDGPNGSVFFTLKKPPAT